MAPDDRTTGAQALRTIARAVAGVLTAAATVSLVGARFGRNGARVAVVVLILGAVLIRRRCWTFALAVLVATPVAAWVAEQTFAPIGGPK